MKRHALLLLSALVLVSSVGTYKLWQIKQLEGPTAPGVKTLSSIQEEWGAKTLPPEGLPSELNIALPFYSQAPFSNWDYPWQEACEEASSALVANLYLNHQWTREEFNEELLRLVDWEMGKFGAYEHTSVTQTAEMIEENYGLNTVIHDNPSYQDLQKSIAAGHLIVAPFAGKLLGNPNFTNGGPIYHMLVIKGYNANKNQVVTHDVGTRKGEDYVYSWDVIQNALHDWDDENIEQGIPRWIEVF